jgi:hypothetical protein
VSGVTRGGAWTPEQITTALWLDAADTSTITLTSGKISAWVDKSGNSRDAEQYDVEKMPSVLSGGLNSLDIVAFNGSGWMLVPEYLFANEYSVNASLFLVGASSGSIGTIISTRAISDGWTFRFVSDVLARYFNTQRPNIDVDTGEGFNILGFVSSGTNIHLTCNGVDANSFSKVGLITSKATGTIIGGETQPTPANRLIGWIAELIAIEETVPVDTKNKIVGYLAHKWGLVDSLPSGHPYKSAAP